MGRHHGHPSTVGMPMKVEHWLASWHPELILTTVQAIMATRSNDPPDKTWCRRNTIAQHCPQFPAATGFRAEPRRPISLLPNRRDRHANRPALFAMGIR